MTAEVLRCVRLVAHRAQDEKVGGFAEHEHIRSSSKIRKTSHGW